MSRLTKHVMIAALLVCATLLESSARADDVDRASQPVAPDMSRLPIMKGGEYTIASGAFLLAVGYMMAVAISLSADQNCQGSICNERYLSFVPVFGGVMQFAVAGKAFHDEHHGDNCFPLTVADVSAQAVGVAGITTGLMMRYFGAKKAKPPVSVTGSFDHGARLALSFAF